MILNDIHLVRLPLSFTNPQNYTYYRKRCLPRLFSFSEDSTPQRNGTNNLLTSHSPTWTCGTSLLNSCHSLIMSHDPFYCFDWPNTINTEQLGPQYRRMSLLPGSKSCTLMPPRSLALADLRQLCGEWLLQLGPLHMDLVDLKGRSWSAIESGYKKIQPPKPQVNYYLRYN